MKFWWKILHCFNACCTVPMQKHLKLVAFWPHPACFFQFLLGLCMTFCAHVLAKWENCLQNNQRKFLNVLKFCAQSDIFQMLQRGTCSKKTKCSIWISIHNCWTLPCQLRHASKIAPKWVFICVHSVSLVNEREEMVAQTITHSLWPSLHFGMATLSTFKIVEPSDDAIIANETNTLWPNLL